MHWEPSSARVFGGLRLLATVVFQDCGLREGMVWNNSDNSQGRWAREEMVKTLTRQSLLPRHQCSLAQVNNDESNQTCDTDGRYIILHGH